MKRTELIGQGLRTIGGESRDFASDTEVISVTYHPYGAEAEAVS